MTPRASKDVFRCGYCDTKFQISPLARACERDHEKEAEDEQDPA